MQRLDPLLGGGLQQRSRAASNSEMSDNVIDIRDGDVFYATVRRYPGIPDIADQVTVVFARTAKERKDRKKTAADRQAAGSTVAVGADSSMSPTHVSNVDNK